MNINTSTARFDDKARALTEDELHKLVPSVFATTAHQSRSQRFAPIPTIEVIKGLAKEGFQVVGARQAVARQPGRADFTKHLLRIRRLDGHQQHAVGDTVFEMLMKNANDGTCQWDLMGGLFRIACLNSMVAAIAALEAIRVRHAGAPETVMAKVIEGTHRVMNEGQRAIEAPVEWSKIDMTLPERTAYAEEAHRMRFADSNGDIKTPVKAEQLLVPRRNEDRKTDLWSTFQVCQEHVIKGGLHAIGHDAQNRQRRVTTRAIRGIDQDVSLNKSLWAFTESVAQSKKVGKA